MKRILILYTSVGLGHKSIAENIGWHLEQGGYQVRLADILQVQGGTLATVSTTVHQFVNRRLPFVWSWLYKSQIVNALFSPFRLFVASRNFFETKKIIDEYNPDLVITTQTTASAVVAYLKQKKIYTKLFAVAFSDFHLHKFWLYDQVDYYLANIEEQKQEMLTKGVAAEKIFVCGMTLKSCLEVYATLVKQKLQVLPGEKVVLIASGSLGIGPGFEYYYKVIHALTSNTKVKVVVVCGKNEQLKQQLASAFDTDQVSVFGYYKPMSELYAIADIFVSKPGGLSTCEALQQGVPILLTHVLPGQEELNVNYLLTHELVMPQSRAVPPPPDHVAATILEELHTKQFKTSMKSNPHLRNLVQDSQGSVAVLKAVNEMFHKV